MIQFTILKEEFYGSQLCKILKENLADQVFNQEIQYEPLPYNYRDIDRLSMIQLMVFMHEIETIFSESDIDYASLIVFEFILVPTARTQYNSLKYTIDDIDGMIKARNFGFIDQRRLRLLSIISNQIHKLSYDSIKKLEILFEDDSDHFYLLVSKFDEMSQHELVKLLIQKWETYPNQKWMYTEYLLNLLTKNSLSKIVMLDPHPRLTRLARSWL